MVQNYTFLEAYQEFIVDKRAIGLAEKTLESYIHVFRAVNRWIPEDTKLADMDQSYMKRRVGEMAAAGLSRNTVKSYTATLKSFFSWCRENGLSDTEIALFKGEETVPETYSQEELKALLKRPNLRSCTFSEYRNWVIINLLVNNGIRAATVRAIQIRDVVLDNSVILLRHTKRRKAQTIPLSDTLVRIMAHYMHVRKGKPVDYLFPDVNGNQMSENCLRLAIARYNKAHGVDKTSIHLFRHTFARMYLVDCGGDALKLQKLLGHSTLKMTQHYVQLFDADLVADFKDHSPLDTLQTSRIRMPRA